MSCEWVLLAVVIVFAAVVGVWAWTMRSGWTDTILAVGLSICAMLPLTLIVLWIAGTI